MNRWWNAKKWSHSRRQMAFSARKAIQSAPLPLALRTGSADDVHRFLWCSFRHPWITATYGYSLLSGPMRQHEASLQQQQQLYVKRQLRNKYDFDKIMRSKFAYISHNFHRLVRQIWNMPPWFRRSMKADERFHCFKSFGDLRRKFRFKIRKQLRNIWYANDRNHREPQFHWKSDDTLFLNNISKEICNKSIAEMSRVIYSAY